MEYSERRLGVFPDFYRSEILGIAEDAAPRPPETDMLTTRDARIASPCRTQQQLLLNVAQRVGHATYAAAPHQLPEEVNPPVPDSPVRGKETRTMAKAALQEPHRGGSYRLPLGTPNRCPWSHSHAEVRGHGPKKVGYQGGCGADVPLSVLPWA